MLKYTWIKIIVTAIFVGHCISHPFLNSHKVNLLIFVTVFLSGFTIGYKLRETFAIGYLMHLLSMIIVAGSALKHPIFGKSILTAIMLHEIPHASLVLPVVLVEHGWRFMLCFTFAGIVAFVYIFFDIPTGNYLSALALGLITKLSSSIHTPRNL